MSGIERVIDTTTCTSICCIFEHNQTVLYTFSTIDNSYIPRCIIHAIPNDCPNELDTISQELILEAPIPILD